MRAQIYIQILVKRSCEALIILQYYGICVIHLSVSYAYFVMYLHFLLFLYEILYVELYDI